MSDNGAGRPFYQPTDEQRKMVEAMSSFGITQDDIADVLGIAPKTLRFHFREQLDGAKTKATAKVAGNLFRQATKNDFKATTAAIFWLKTQAGWKEPVYNVHSGNVGVDHIDKMNDDELDEYIAERAARVGLRSGAKANGKGEDKPN